MKERGITSKVLVKAFLGGKSIREVADKYGVMACRVEYSIRLALTNIGGKKGGGRA